MEEKIGKVKEYLGSKKRVYISAICKDLELEEYEVYGLIEMLKQKGYMYEVIGDKIERVKIQKDNEVYKVPSMADKVKLLLISDTHLASKYDRVDILNYLYDKAESRHVDYVFHSGDLCEGLSGRPQQIYELKECSYTGQRDYVIEKYPKSDIPTYVIAGNHDLWWVKQCGADIVKDICLHREDLHYLGSDCEDIMIGKLRVRMYHGAKGSSYAKSYRLQKYLDAIPSEELPHILQTGHIHQAFYMKQGKTHCFQTSCLQDLTPYERSLGMNNDKSVWWVDVYMDNKGNPMQVCQELETFSGGKLTKRR